MAANITYQGMPGPDSKFVDSDGRITMQWYQFLVSLYNRSGLATPDFGINQPKSVDGTLTQRVYPQFYATDPNSAASKVLVLRDQTTGALIGLITYTP